TSSWPAFLVERRSSFSQTVLIQPAGMPRMRATYAMLRSLTRWFTQSSTTLMPTWVAGPVAMVRDGRGRVAGPLHLSTFSAKSWAAESVEAVSGEAAEEMAAAGREPADRNTRLPIVICTTWLTKRAHDFTRQTLTKTYLPSAVT